MHTTIIIPARYQATRLPGKLLKLIQGKAVLEWVFLACKKVSKNVEVVIATDNEQIKMHAESFGATVFLTSIAHESGTSRCIEVAKKLSSDIVINVQGDEPFIDSAHIKLMIDYISNNQSTDILTLFSMISDQNEINNPNNVKLVKDHNNKILFFSRSVIPYNRGAINHKFYKHIGIYGFRRSTLLNLENLLPSSLESAEKLEQLRWMENGFGIHGIEVEGNSISIDTQDDLEKARIYADGLSK
jgi:3-deoxy-manno-octulosonate cytidylyltransferase (CMP-KDO synthetase)